RAERELRAGIIGYLVVGTLVWMIPNPLGGNATRLGALFGGPLLVAALRSGRVRLATPAVVLVLVGSVWWQVSGAVRDVARSFGDPSTRAAYAEPRARWLRAHGGSGVRIEVPFTSGHWETAYLAPEFELARGWLRQLDRSRNGPFYRDRLPSARYRAWLVRSGIRYVALADTATDYSARAEQRLMERRPRYLHLKAMLYHWHVYLWAGALRPTARRRGSAPCFGYHHRVPRLLLLLLLLLLVAALVRYRTSRGGHEEHAWLPKGWPDALHQIALFALADLCYETVRGVA